MKTLALLLAVATPAFAQVTPAAPGGFTTGTTGATAEGTGVAATTPAAKAKPLGAGDKKFLKDSLEGMYFVMAAIGKTRTNGRDVTKTESTALKADLDKVWADVAGYASNANEKVPADLVGGDKGKIERLGKEKDKFDKEFFKLVNKEVEKLAKTFESYGKTGTVPEIKTIATNWEPTLKAHVSKLDAAEKEVAKMK